MPDPVVWGFKAVKPFDAEHPVGSGTMVHYAPGDEVPASEWGRAEGFMVEAGSIMRYVRNVVAVPGQVASVPAGTMDAPVAVPTEAPPVAEPAADVELEEGGADDPPDGLAVPDDATFPHHLGAGWYVLSDGERVRGKAQAIAQQAALDVAAESEVTV